ncbi:MULTISPECIES: hypothetical protein [unclassified Streptomyces]|uniref:hypothetical protein n=1 Tax=unclassified Streptomyces TaxID=2593676 RepID=UPI0036E2D9E6
MADQGGDELAGSCLGQSLRGRRATLPGSARLDVGALDRLYEHDLGALYLAYAPAYLDDNDAALALIASFSGISVARIRHGLTCRHFATTGDESRMGVALAAPASA